MEHLSAALLEWVQAHGMKGVSLFMVVENLGLPFPTEAGFITAQALINAATNPLLAYWVAFAYITAGHLVGAGIGYQAGRAGDSALARWFSHSRRMMRAREKTQNWYAKYGAVTVLFGRLVGQVRPWASFLAGAAGVRPVQYWLWTTIGTLIYVPIAMWFTAWGWDYWMKYPQIRVPAVILTLLVFYGAALYAVARQYVKRRRRKRLEEERRGEETACQVSGVKCQEEGEGDDG